MAAKASGRSLVMDSKAQERFNAKVQTDTETGCWVWAAHRYRTGYGRFKLKGHQEFAHRVAYGSWIGPVPVEMELDHLCRNRACVNPGHLEPVTSRENSLRGDTFQAANARKTHCPEGHDYTADNTYVRSSSKKNPYGCRECRTCRRERVRLCRQRKKLAVATAEQLDLAV